MGRSFSLVDGLFGIPLVEFGDVTFVHGHFNSP
jgi:hypothetical protein